MNIKNIFLLSLISLFTIISCKPGKDEDLTYIKKLEEQCYSPKAVKLDNKLANELILAYADFCNKYPQDTLSPGFLFKAGEVAMSLNLGTQALEYFGRFKAQYPNLKKAPHCLFLEGFIYETILKDLVKAKEKYLEFLEKYPNHELAKDAKASIELLGKSPEDVIKSFEEKAKQEDKK